MDQLEKEMFDVVNRNHAMATSTPQERRRMRRQAKARAWAKKWRNLLISLSAFILAVLMSAGLATLFLYLLYILKGR